MDLKGVPRHAVHALMGILHATIERLTTHIAKRVEAKQCIINLGMERWMWRQMRSRSPRVYVEEP